MEKLHYFDISSEHLSADHFCYKNLNKDGFRPHTHDRWELIFIKSGSISYLSEGKCYTVAQGSCILTPPGICHSIRFQDMGIYDRYTILFPYTQSNIALNFPEVILLEGHPIVYELFQKMDFYADYLDAASLEKIILHLTEEVLLNFQIISHALPQEYTANPLITQAISYINAHLHTHITLEDLSAHLHIGKSYLHRLFLKHLQVSPSKFIIGKQLNKARMQIRAGNKPTNIYSQCGFSDYCTFYRNFVRHFGYTPSEEQNRPYSQRIEW